MQRNCKVRILDEVSCVFVGLHPDHIGAFYDKYSMFAPNYFFNPKFKLGRWDGKIRFFFKTGKTYVSLLNELIPQVVSLGYKISIDDLREVAYNPPAHVSAAFFADAGIIDPKTNEPWIIRDYQLELINSLIDNGGGVGIAGTGGGKTSMTAALAKSYEISNDLRSIIIVPDKNLTRQTKGQYEFFGLDVGEYSGDDKDIEHQHVVSTWQALKNKPELIQSFQVVIVDECHGLRGNVLTSLMNEHGKHIPYRFGVTGTLPKDPSDVMAVRVAVGEVQYQIPAHVLIEQGHLSNLQIDIMQHEIDLKKQYQDFLTEDPLPVPTYIQFKDSYFPDWAAEKKFLQNEQNRLDWIVEYITSVSDLKKGNTLCLVNGVEFGKELASLIPNAHFLYGKDKMKARAEIYQLFEKEDNLVVIATVQIASTGLDIPRIFNMIFIDVGKSFIRVIQSIGRGLRKAHDKDFVRVSDICSDLKYSKRHLRERIKYYKEAKYPHKKHKIQHTEYTNADI